jgi:hypothetical protein
MSASVREFGVQALQSLIPQTAYAAKCPSDVRSTNSTSATITGRAKRTWQ